MVFAARSDWDVLRAFFPQDGPVGLDARLAARALQVAERAWLAVPDEPAVQVLAVGLQAAPVLRRDAPAEPLAVQAEPQDELVEDGRFAERAVPSAEPAELVWRVVPGEPPAAQGELVAASDVFARPGQGGPPELPAELVVAPVEPPAVEQDAQLPVELPAAQESDERG